MTRDRVRVVVRGGRATDGRDPLRVARTVPAAAALWLWFDDLAPGGSQDALTLARAVAALRPDGITVAGAFRAVADLEALLSRPVDRIALGDAALTDPSLIDFCVQAFGAARVAVVVPWRTGLAGEPEVFADGGRAPTGRDVVAWCRQATRRGASELVLVDLAGDDPDRAASVVAAVQAAVTVPVAVTGATALATAPLLRDV